MSRFNTLARPRSESEAGGAFFAYVWSFLAGLLVPAVVVLVGVLAVLLNSDSGLSGQRVQLGNYLWVPLPESLVNQGALIQLTALVGVAFAASTLFCLSIWRHRKAADDRARRVVKALHGRVLRQSLRRAELEGAAAQHVRAEQLIGQQLPSIQAGLSLWYRSIPRSVLMMLGCVALALLVDVWLTLLAVVSSVLLWQLFRRLRNTEQGELADWEVPRARTRMAELVGQAPLLARLQTQGLADRAFGTELDTLYRRLSDEDSRRGRIWPLVFFATSVAIAVMILGLGVNLFDAELGPNASNGLSVPAALVLGLALTGAAAAAGRLISLASQLRISGEASDSVYHYLAHSDEIAPSEQRVGLAGLRDGVEIHDVTLGDSQQILSHLSLRLEPGSLVALLGTELVSTRALAELIMGFGRPQEGRVTIDGIPLLDVHPQALARN
ncbi:MAG: ABC transporter ATP-binding protein, partial [Pirellulales bacterium]|nr:ABC transporter ATP-binding protein [Pirellulales bacterium]